MATGNHPDIVGPYVHVIHNWTYATAAARTAATAFMSWDVYKIALQSDDNSLWLLLDDSPPTWLQLTGPGVSSAVTSVNTQTGAVVLDADDIDDTATTKKFVTPSMLTSSLNFLIDGGGSVIVAGIKGDMVIDFNCTIQGVTTLADQSGSIVVDIWKDTYANFPPVDADSITAAAPVTIATATKSQDTTLTGWSVAITAGQTLRFNVDSCATIQRATVALKVIHT